jgi:hypothetical protein
VLTTPTSSPALGCWCLSDLTRALTLGLAPINASNPPQSISLSANATRTKFLDAKEVGEEVAVHGAGVVTSKNHGASIHYRCFDFGLHLASPLLRRRRRRNSRSSRCWQSRRGWERRCCWQGWFRLRRRERWQGRLCRQRRLRRLECRHRRWRARWPWRHGCGRHQRWRDQRWRVGRGRRGDWTGRPRARWRTRWWGWR